MNAYLPPSLPLALATGALIAVTLLLALAVSRMAGLAGRVAAWGLVVGAFAVVEGVCRDAPAGFRMLAICGAVLFAMKAVVAVEDHAARGVRLAPAWWLAWAGLWPGMRPVLFERRVVADREGGGALALAGLRRLLLGVAFLVAAAVAFGVTGSRVLATVLELPGISLVLHFGLFNLAAGGWRAVGIDAGPLFLAPLLSTSLGEFWGRRWNLPFTEMTRIAVYGPLRPRVGRGVAAVAGFLFSAALHELAISVPVRAGYGLPLAYFALHGVLVQLERALARRGYDVARRPWLGRAWTLGWLALPMPVLFHPPFLRGVVWPLIGMA